MNRMALFASLLVIVASAPTSMAQIASPYAGQERRTIKTLSDQEIQDILEGKRLEITEDTPEFYADLMRKCWDPNPENRPTAKEIRECLGKYLFFFNGRRAEEKIIELAESKRQEIIKSEKYLIDEKNNKNYPESFYTSHPLSKLIEKANSLKFSSNKQDDTSINDLPIPKYFG